MKQLSKEAMEERDLLQNEYFVNQIQLQRQNKKWKNLCTIAFSIAGLILAGSTAINIYAMQIAKQAKSVQKIVFKTDGTGGLTLIGEATGKLDVKDPKYVSAQLMEYVKALYSIPPDNYQRTYNAYKVQYMTDPKYYPLYPQLILQDEYTKEGANVVNIDFSVAGQVTAGVWEVDWFKTINNGKKISYKTMITFRQVTTSADLQTNLYNGLGILITNIDTQERLQTDI